MIYFARALLIPELKSGSKFREIGSMDIVTVWKELKACVSD